MLIPSISSGDWLTGQFGLSGRSALVTGGGSGIGKAMSWALGAAGARILLCGRRTAVLDSAVAEFRKEGIEASHFICDLTLKREIQRCADYAVSIAGCIDILVNAAGFNLRQPFMDVTEENWNRHLSIHLSAPFFLTQKLAPAMSERRWGRIINVASLQSSRAFRDSAPYGAGKGGIVQLTRAIAEHWSKCNVTCNAIAPGFFPTELTASVFDNPEEAAEQACKTMVGRNGAPEDLHGLTVFLASNASRYITGQTIHVDGGYSAK